MTRQILFLDLVDDAQLIAAYEDWHRAGRVPAAVIAGIRASGIREMQIWRRDDRLVMLIETGPDYDPAAKAARDAADPETMRWERQMEPMQRPIPSAQEGEKWLPAALIFDLATH